MAKINIIIKGVAIVYHKRDGLWKVLFPFDNKNCHTIRFKLSDGEPGTSLAAENRQIRVRAVNPASQFGVGNNYNDFLDLTADYSHSNGMEQKSGWQRKAVLMSIENAVFSRDEMTKSRYLLKENGQIKKDSARIGYSGRAEIEADQVIVEVTGPGGFSKTFEQDVTVIFDNTCPPDVAKTDYDFEMIYDVLQDKNNPARQFAVERDPADLPLRPSEEKNVFDNPAPKEEGLPCHLVIITNPDDPTVLP